MEALVSNTDIYKNTLLKVLSMPVDDESISNEWRGAYITFEPHEHIEGTVEAYVKHELDWYKSQDLCILGHEGIETNPIWKKCATDNGHINSNYGWCIFSRDNGSQFEKALDAIKRNNSTRQACMYYTRPAIHSECRDLIHARYDMICTCYVSMLLRDGLLEYNVHMRSNDAWHGLRNDLAWHQYVQEQAVKELKAAGIKCACGQIRWFTDSLHIYKNKLRIIKEYLNDTES